MKASLPLFLLVGSLSAGCGSTTEPTTPAYETKALAVSGDCAIMRDRTVRCWDKTGKAVAPVPDLHDVQRLANFGQPQCALLGSGAVACWGSKTSVDATRGETVERVGPLDVAAAKGALDLVSGGSEGTTCAVLAGGRLACFGAAWSACTSGCTLNTPPGCESGVKQAISAGGDTAVLRTDGGVHASCNAPADPLGPAVAFAAGLSHRCAIGADGTLTCHGLDRGQLGRPVLTKDAPRTVVLSEIGAVAEVVSAMHETCARTVSGDVWCFGVTSSTGVRRDPARIEGLGKVAAISMNLWATSVLDVDGGVTSWTTFDPTPTKVRF
ncbi:MAG: hypothetical protein JNL79_20230 [Myxococcales bacterium]|nr:hypothetical protein [Myxococcales bacterium]